MAYEKIYKGQRETGVVTKYEYIDEAGKTCFHEIAEKEPHHEIEWVQKWQPEHAPVGSVVRYKSSRSFAPDDELVEVTVTGHYWNGVKSWVVLTDDVCQIRGGDSKCSFNGDHIREIVSRGKGGVQFTNNKQTIKHFTENYNKGLTQLPSGVKRPHLYAAHLPSDIVGYVLTTHPRFADFFDGMHENMFVHDITKMLAPLFQFTWTSTWSGYATINKKKLIKALARIIPRGRTSKLISWKAEQKAAAEDYRRDMEDFFNDL
jgi:hypothetical protein